MFRRTVPITLAITIALTLVFAALAAPSADPATYFTANLPAPDTPSPSPRSNRPCSTASPAPRPPSTPRSTTSTAPSLRDALLAAHARGVQIRIVTDDEAHANPSYAPYYDALTAAGIPVVDDQDDTRIMHDKYAIIDGATVWTGQHQLVRERPDPEPQQRHRLHRRPGRGRLPGRL